MIVKLGLRVLVAVLRLAAWVATLTWACIWFLGGIALCLIGFGWVGAGAIAVGATPVSGMLAAGASRRSRRAAMTQPGAPILVPAQPAQAERSGRCVVDGRLSPYGPSCR
jgi:hypothetical protein